jgi:hypothetical protein
MQKIKIKVKKQSAQDIQDAKDRAKSAADKKYNDANIKALDESGKRMNAYLKGKPKK